MLVDGFSHHSIFWFVIFSVQLSAVSNLLRLLDLGNILLFLKNPMFSTANWTVLVALTCCPSTVMNFGFLYSPTLRR